MQISFPESDINAESYIKLLILIIYSFISVKRVHSDGRV